VASNICQTLKSGGGGGSSSQRGGGGGGGGGGSLRGGGGGGSWQGGDGGGSGGGLGGRSSGGWDAFRSWPQTRHGASAAASSPGASGQAGAEDATSMYDYGYTGTPRESRQGTSAQAGEEDATSVYGNSQRARSNSLGTSGQAREEDAVTANEHTRYTSKPRVESAAGAAKSWVSPAARKPGGLASGRGLHSSTVLLIVSTFCGIRWVLDFPPVH